MRGRGRRRESGESRRGGCTPRSAGKWHQGGGVGRNSDKHIDCSSLVDNKLETEPGPSWPHLTTAKWLKDEIGHI